MKHKLLVKHILNMASASLVCAAIFLGSSGRLDIDTPAVGGTEIDQEIQAPEDDDLNNDKSGRRHLHNNSSGNKNEISPQDDKSQLTKHGN